MSSINARSIRCCIFCEFRRNNLTSFFCRLIIRDLNNGHLKEDAKLMPDLLAGEHSSKSNLPGFEEEFRLKNYSGHL